MSTPRASIFDGDELDITGFAPKNGPDRSAPAPADVRAVAEAANFRSREAVPLVAPTAKRTPRRHRTGRNVQLNIKVSQEALDMFYAISDRQGWVLGETLEHALAALEQTLPKNNAAAKP